MTHNNLNNDQKILLIFLHIPKTGGTTLARIISNQYPSNIHYRNGLWSEILKDKEQLEMADTLCGHFGFGVHSLFSRPFTYITMLRDPIEQVISWFYFRYKSPYHDQFNGSFDEYISSDQFNYATDNLQARFLCGDNTPNLEKAKQNLTNYFSLAGITELFDESVFIMKKEFGWENISYNRENTNRNRPNKNQFSKSTINKIKEKNEIDLQLYYSARQILEDKIRSLDNQSKQELDLFKSSHSS